MDPTPASSMYRGYSRLAGHLKPDAPRQGYAISPAVRLAIGMGPQCAHYLSALVVA